MKASGGIQGNCKERVGKGVGKGARMVGKKGGKGVIRFIFPFGFAWSGLLGVNPSRGFRLRGQLQQLRNSIRAKKSGFVVKKLH